VSTSSNRVGAAAVAEPALAESLFDVGQAAAQLLGGSKVFPKRVRTPLQFHAVLTKGLPSDSLSALESRVTVLTPADVRRAIGLSTRTIQRFRGSPAKTLSPEQSGRTWKFASVLAKATDVLGDQAAAERWLDTPALALDGSKPIELLTTPVGTEMVERLLGRIEHSVYT
jgi:putative toxin-antitoxin system antitoxin component (TIGR02293 family)